MKGRHKSAVNVPKILFSLRILKPPPTKKKKKKKKKIAEHDIYLHVVSFDLEPTKTFQDSELKQQKYNTLKRIEKDDDERHTAKYHIYTMKGDLLKFIAVSEAD